MNRYYNEVAISPLIRGDAGKADRGVLNAGRAKRGSGVPSGAPAPTVSSPERVEDTGEIRFVGIYGKMRICAIILR